MLDFENLRRRWKMIKKQDAGKLTPQDEVDLRVIEKYLDQEIEDQWEPHAVEPCVTVNVDTLTDQIKGRFTARLRREVKNMCENAGWRVDFVEEATLGRPKHTIVLR